MDVLFGVIHSTTLLEKFTVSYSDSFKRLINVPRYTSSNQLESGICDEHNWLYQCGVPQIYLQLDEQSGFPHRIVTAIVNSDAYHQSPLMDKWESMLYV